MRVTAFVAALIVAGLMPAASAHTQEFTRADSLRGSLTAPERTWWDVTFYDLHVRVSPADSTIRGSNAITYRVVRPPREMQIDLQAPLRIDSIVQGGRRLRVRQEGDAWFATPAPGQRVGSTQTVTVHYGGRPVVATRPPWDGGFTWAADSLGRPFIATSNQGIGASVWWPNKDIGEEEPDSQRIAITLPDPLVQIGNGRLRGVTPNGDGTTTWEWFVSNPINNYGISVNVGSYAHFGEFYEGERGVLTMDYYPLDYNLERARRQFAQARTTIQCFEHWFGPYPWYEDGFKLIEVPYLGMEHQSAVTYGNRYMNGYLGRDLSGTGLGLEWDFIIVHETAHEWFANNITAKDQADMWVHESFANYAEALYTECLRGKEAGARYAVGVRQGISNDRPIVPEYGVNAEGSGDMYNKGGTMLHTIRQIIGDDQRWRAILRGLNTTFRHRTVTGEQVERYIGEQAGVDLGRVFDQYLRTTMIPVLEHRNEGGSLHYRWANVVPGFDMPVRARIGGEEVLLRPTTEWQSRPLAGGAGRVVLDENFYAEAREVGGR